MDDLKKTTVFDECVAGSMERFKELIGPLFTEFSSFYWALQHSNIEADDIGSIEYKNMGATAKFTINASDELIKKDELLKNAVAINIPVQGGRGLSS